MIDQSRWRHDMATIATLLSLYEWKPPASSGFSSQRYPEHILEKQSRFLWIVMPWRSCNVASIIFTKGRWLIAIEVPKVIFCEWFREPVGNKSQVFPNKVNKKEYTRHIPDGNKIEHSYTESHSHMQIILSFANFCSWMSFPVSKIHNKMYACGYLCMHVWPLLHNSCWFSI